MRKLFIFLITIFSVVFSSTEVLNLNAVHSTGIIKIQWQTSVETNIKELRVEKSSDNVSYSLLSSENPKGSSSTYTILDTNPYSKRTVLYYRVVVVDYDGTDTISLPVSVTIDTSGIGATWGSIKAMFR